MSIHNTLSMSAQGENLEAAQAAYILRLSPSLVNQVPTGLESNQLLVGWAKAQGLLDPNLSWWEFRQIVKDAYYEGDSNQRRAGAAAGSLWRFIREMKPGDLVAVPHGGDFYVAQVTSDAIYDDGGIDDETSHRRTVIWCNDGKPLSRRIARSTLLSRLKSYQTCAYATDLLEDIKDCLRLAENQKLPTFSEDLHERLMSQVLTEIRTGRIDSYVFERLVKSVLLGLGAEDCQIIPRSQDKGADLLATFRIASAFLQTVAVQVKHWQPDSPVGGEVVAQLIRGIEAESANFGMVITSGLIGDSANEAAMRYFEEKGIRIELVDGEQFAQLMIEHGLHRLRRTVLH